jgi:hypothetical protein
MIRLIFIVVVIAGVGWLAWRRWTDWRTPITPQPSAERSPQTRAFEAFTRGNRCLMAEQWADATAAFEQARTLDPKRPYVAERHRPGPAVRHGRDDRLRRHGARADGVPLRALHPQCRQRAPGSAL